MDATQYLTEEKEVLLRKELEELKTVRRKEILEVLEYARSLGDLSENAEYHNARDEQGRLEDRISKIEYILRNAIIVSGGAHGGTVEVGSTVVVEKEGTKDKITYSLVGSEEADMAAGKISNNSPLGEALMGKKKGDTVLFKTPKGEVAYKIIDVK